MSEGKDKTKWDIEIPNLAKVWDVENPNLPKDWDVEKRNPAKLIDPNNKKENE